MKAVFHTGLPAAWGPALGDKPWCLAPAGGKPLLEYWLEWAADLGATDVRLVLGDGAADVEAFAGDGSRWGLAVTYGFLKNTADPDAYLRRSPEQWSDGLLYLAGPVFPRRLAPPPWPKPAEGPAFRLQVDGRTVCLLSPRVRDLASLLAGPPEATPGAWGDLALAPFALADIAAYFALNMALVEGESERYVSTGYASAEGAQIGYNVVIPPSVELRPPLTIGNDCRIHPMAVIGPRAVIGNRVIVDRQTELADCVILDDTYLGRNLEIRGKIVRGSRLVDPVDGESIDIAEPWLLAGLKAPAQVGDAARALGGWLLAVLLTLVQALPFLALFPWISLWNIGRYRLSPRLGPLGKPLRIPVWSLLEPGSRLGRLFTGLGLDLFPLIALAALGRLWLCGHAPLHPERDRSLLARLRRCYPAAIGYHSRRFASGERPAEAAEALYYERYRSPREDLRTIFRTLSGRFLDALSGEAPSGE